MIPIALDPSLTAIALAGRGGALLRRLLQLRTLGGDPQVFCDAPEEAIEKAAGSRLVRRLPTVRDLRDVQVLWATGLDQEAAARLAADARAAKTLVNVEDVRPFCDFHMPAVVQRGALTLSASTGGASPAAARFAREQLERAFPEDWAHALEELAAARMEAREGGRALSEIVGEAREVLARRGLLSDGDGI